MAAAKGRRVRRQTRCLALLAGALGAALSMAAQEQHSVHAEVEIATVANEHMPLEAEASMHSFSSLSGTVTDSTDAVIPGALVTLEGADSGEKVTLTSGADGSFVFGAVPPGAYRVTVRTEGFEDWSSTEEVGSGEHLSIASIELAMVRNAAVVEVRASGRQVAEAQIQLEEKQRVLGVFPNFYASYAPDAEPLSAGQKFRLATRFATDPVAFAMAAVVAGSEQRANSFAGYGPGAAGYVKRLGAAYTDGLASTLIGGALLPSVFHQDPRYFVKGTGSVGSRTLYAISSMVMCKGDNRRWQVNYSNVLGNFASAGLSNAYYPSENRGAGLVVQNALTATALGAVGGLFQEFLLHRMTPHLPDYAAAQ